MRTSTDQHAHASSTGQAFTTGDWLDLHYQVAEPEYLALLDAAGLQPGWHTLDAGCGSGCFLPVIAERLGAAGRISALDLAPEHIGAIRTRLAAQPLICPVETKIGSLLDLPYPDQHFDAIWSANVSQYLTDDELRVMLAECMRVLKRGGLLAIKDVDATAWQMLPIDPTLLWRLLGLGIRRSHTPTRGILRTLRLGEYLSAAGFQQVVRTTINIERSSPLRPVEAQYLLAIVTLFAAGAPSIGASEDDCTTWRSYSDPESPSYILHQPEIFMREGNVLIVGRKG